MKSKKISRCISCAHDLPTNCSKERRYCISCTTERRRVGACMRYLRQRKKRATSKRRLTIALRTGKRYSAKELQLITGYKHDSLVQMISQSPLQIKRAYMYYI